MNKKIPKQIPKTHNRNDSNRVSQKDLYEELWHGRDFEIQTLWQRSIFLTAFLVLVFSGYGILWLKYLELTPQISFNSYLDWCRQHRNFRHFEHSNFPDWKRHGSPAFWKKVLSKRKWIFGVVGYRVASEAEEVVSSSSILGAFSSMDSRVPRP